MKITDELLLAYIDGELSREERARVETAIAGDPELAERLRRHRSVEGRIHEAFSGVAEEPAPDHLVEMARPAAPVVSLEAARASRKAEAKPKPGKTSKPTAGKTLQIDRRWAVPALALIVGAALGYLAPRTNAGLMDGDMRATGALDAVLTGRLASTQAADAPIRIGATFKNKGGAWCRSFASRQLSGVACREGGEWRLKVAEIGAGATSSAATATVSALIKGAPADAATEKRAQASGWR